MGVIRFSALAVSLFASLAHPLAAQSVSEVRVRSAIEDASRGLGQTVAGGSALTAPAATTGGLGHVQIGAAASVTRVEIEDPRRTEGQLDFFLPVGTINAAVGLTGGGVAGLGAVDLLGRVGPVVAREDYRDNRLLYAVGVRVGLLREGALAPAISATIVRTWIDGLEYGDRAGDEISFAGDVRSLSARLDASKQLLLATPYVGVGLDRTAIEAEYRIPASRSTADREITGAFESSSFHSKAYVGVELALALASLTAEIGRHDSGSFAALGLRLGL